MPHRAQKSAGSINSGTRPSRTASQSSTGTASQACTRACKAGSSCARAMSERSRRSPCHVGPPSASRSHMNKACWINLHRRSTGSSGAPDGMHTSSQCGQISRSGTYHSSACGAKSPGRCAPLSVMTGHTRSFAARTYECAESLSALRSTSATGWRGVASACMRRSGRPRLLWAGAHAAGIVDRRRFVAASFRASSLSASRWCAYEPMRRSAGVLSGCAIRFACRIQLSVACRFERRRLPRRSCA